MLGPDPADRAAGRAHHHGFGFDHFSAEQHAAQHAAVGNAGCGEQALAFDHVFKLIFAAGIFDTHFGGACAFFFGVEHKARLHLPADAAQRRRRQHALGRAADAEIDVDAGGRVGGMDDARHVAVGDQRNRGAGLAHTGNQVGMARPVEQQRGDLLRFDALGLGEVDDVVSAGASRSTTPFG